MREVGVPIVPGSDGAIDDPEEALAIAEEIGFPVLIKAAAGGGGKGMRVAPDGRRSSAVQMAQNEAGAAFGDDSVYLEKYLARPRHIEFQVLGDQHGRSSTSASATARCSGATRS
jgi:acetyl-CoA carboxylase, biotin carboxylase subunit